MLFRLLCLLAAFPLAEAGARTVVANYANDFNPSGAPAAGWNYLWNAPAGWAVGTTGDQASGFIGSPLDYRAMVLFGSSYYADGDSTGGNNAPSGFLRLSATGGHPGPAAGVTNKRARYAIAAFTVATGGHYAIEESSISLSNAGSDGVEVLVLPGKSEAVFRTMASPAAAASFDTEIGYLDAGQTIYVAFGPGTTASNDAFLMNFSVVRYERLSFRDQLFNGIASGTSTITILPGRYYANPTSAYATVSNFNPPNHVTIAASGVELISQSPNQSLAFVNCSNITVQGLRIDYNPQLYRQGTVESVSSNTFRLRLHEGYPQTLTPAATSGIIYEPASLRMKQLTDTFYPTAVTQVEPGLYTITTASPLANLTAGDYASLTEPINIPHAIYLEGCRDMRLEDIEIHGSPSFGLLSRGALRVELENVSVKPGSTPLRAAVPRLLSSNADGLHFKHSIGGIRVNNCRLAYNGDDSIVLTSSYHPIIGKTRADVITVSTKARQEVPAAGDSLYLYNPETGTRESATIQSVVKVANMTEEEIRALIALIFPRVRLTDSTFEQAYILTLDTPVTAPVGGWVADRGGDSSGFEVSNCTVENTRARGILIKASNGAVRNNFISNTLLAGIQLRPEAEIWMEGDFAHNVTIQKNELRRCAIGRSNANAPLNVTSEKFENWTPGSGHSNLTIIGNTFFDSPGASIYVQYADDVKIRSNRFTTTHNVLGQSPRFASVIQLQNVNNVEILGLNTAMAINQTNANMNALIGSGAKVTGLSINAGILVSSDQDLLPDVWETRYFGSATGADADSDPDGDGRTSYLEYLTGLNPLQRDEIFVILDSGSQPMLRWMPMSNRFITIYSTESLGSPFTILAENIPAELGAYGVPPVPVGGSVFYKLGITD